MFEAFLRKGNTNRFEDGRRTTLVGYALRGLTLAGDQAKVYWLMRLAELEPAELPLIASRIPTMSDLARIVAVNLLTANRRRLLDG